VPDSSFRVPPADKGFRAAHPERLRIDNGLKVDFELVSTEGSAQLAFENVSLNGGLAQRWLEYRVQISAESLGTVKCQVSLLQQIVGINSMSRRQRDADAGTDAYYVAVN
jgi:hypothetical protein